MTKKDRIKQYAMQKKYLIFYKDKPDLGIVFGIRKITPEIIKCFKDV